MEGSVSVQIITDADPEKWYKWLLLSWDPRVDVYLPLLFTSLSVYDALLLSLSLLTEKTKINLRNMTVLELTTIELNKNRPLL
jgi:hypothetical protein